MASLLINPAELEQLAGLPHSAVALYLVLRRLMDYATGLVGVTRGVSWQGLREELYVEGRQGMSSRSVSREQVRRIAGHLEHAGLVERHSIEMERLIFFLPKAQTDTCARKKSDTSPTQARPPRADRVASPPSPQKSMFFVMERGEGRPKPTQAEMAKPDTPPVSGFITPLTSFGGNAPPETGGAPRLDSGTDAMRTVCAEIWRAYSEAYRMRYGIPPIRNAKSHAQVRQLAQRIGVDESPGLAAWFVSHDGNWYVRQGHQIGSLLADCEKLRTEWVTGRRMTATRARQLDQTAANVGAVSEAMEILERARVKHA
ncbi:MAG: hypothetical protein WBX11_00140 [Thiobacillaceae bacterium]